MSLANKYRPKSFDTIIGQEHITGILKAKMQKDAWWKSNFILFGPRGTGKTSSARILAKAMNCLDLQEGNPCNKCANCMIIDEGKTLDYVEIDAASHTGVDNIREEVIDKALYPPTMLKKKIYVIDEVHMLSKGLLMHFWKLSKNPKKRWPLFWQRLKFRKSLKLLFLAVRYLILGRCLSWKWSGIWKESVMLSQFLMRQMPSPWSRKSRKDVSVMQ
jgi:DNA polymerase III delta prime subunit